jgi:hypothetical protein
MRQVGFSASDIAIVSAGSVESGSVLDDAMDRFHDELIEQNYQQVEASGLAVAWGGVEAGETARGESLA